MATAAPEIPVLARDQAFESLYRRYVKDVYHYALALLRNPADAEDVTQTTFLNAYRAYQRGIEIEKPQNWLIKIAHNVARTRYARASRRVKEVPLDDHVDGLAVAESDLPDLQEVIEALGRLPFNQRAALVMRELEGRSYAEISDTIGVSVSAVETLIFRARKSLRLKASAIRSLAVVPLPSSLLQFFEGGGLVAGGGGTVAGGFLIKAAVALVAGAVATGIGGDHTGPAAAASDALTPLTAPAPFAGIATPKPVWRLRASSAGAQVAARASVPRASVRNGAIIAVAGPKRAAGLVAAPATESQAARPATTAAAQPRSSTPSTPVSQAVTEVVAVVETTVHAVELPAVTVPVQVPPVPAIPVEAPKLPGGTPQLP
jgi:RNA polymerase sigma factor (sigma-70 family)